MTRCYLDANFLFQQLRIPPDPGRRESDQWINAVDAMAEGEPKVASALVVDELAYRLTLTWLRDEGVPDPLTAFRNDERSAMVRVRDRLNEVFAELNSTLAYVHSTDAVVLQAQALMAQPGLAPRDAFHAAHAIHGGCEVIVSNDDAFDAVSGLRRLGP